MRAVVCSGFGPFSQLALTDFPDPQPGPNDVLIDVVAAGVNFPDRLIVAGKYQMRPELPFVPGAEAAGDIPKIPLNLPLLKNNSVVGVFWGAWAARDPAASLENYGELFRMYREGKIKPLVSQVFDLENFAGAFEAIEERRAQGKVILRVGES